MPEEFDPDDKYEITFWAKNESHPDQKQVYSDAVAAFEKLYPNIDVTLKVYSNYERIYQDAITNIGTGTTPNICITYPDHIATYNTGGNIVVPLDELMANEEYGLGGSKLRFDGVKREDIVTAFLAEGVIDGKQYALPYMRSTEACYINVDLLEKLGYELPPVLTWEFIFEVSEAAINYGKHTGVDKKGNSVELYNLNGDSVLIPFIYKSSDNMMIQYLEQSGADYTTDSGEILFYNDTSKALIDEIAYQTKIGAFSTFTVVSYPGNFLNAGQCIFAIDSTAGATWMGSDAPHIDISEDNLTSFNLAVMPVPQVNPEDPKMISQGPSICVFNKEDPGEVLASWLFAQFLLTENIQIAYSQTEGYIPVTTTAQQSEEYLDYLSRRGEEHPNNLYLPVKIDAAKILLDNLDNTFVTSVFNGSASVRNAAGGLIDETVKTVNRNQPTTPSDIDAIYSKLVSQYHLDQINVANSNNENDNLSVHNLGPLPVESLVLLIVLSAIWLGLGITFAFLYVKKRKQNKIIS